MRYLAYIVMLVMLCAPVHALDALQEQIIAMRVAFYSRAAVPSLAEIESLYGKIQQLPQGEDRLFLGTYWGILASEVYLYGRQHSGPELRGLLARAYHEQYQAAQDSSVAVQQKSGEYALLLLRVFPQQRLAYLMDARRFFMLALRRDPENESVRVSLGRWWAYRVIESKHRELNHGTAQAEKYLADEHLVHLSDQNATDWDKIDLFNIYRLRAALRMKSLEKEAAMADRQRARQVFIPTSPLMRRDRDLPPNLLVWF